MYQNYGGKNENKNYQKRTYFSCGMFMPCACSADSRNGCGARQKRGKPRPDRLLNANSLWI